MAGTPSEESSALRGPRRLVLLRHAKSGYPDGVSDHDRPLAPRGRLEAVLAGEVIARLTGGVDSVLCSTAVRARQTLAATGVSAPTTVTGDIYAATAGAILARIRKQPDAAATLLVVGHAPGIPGLALALAGAGSNPCALAALHTGYPTAAVAVLTTDDPWSDLGSAAASLISFVVPR